MHAALHTMRQSLQRLFALPFLLFPFGPFTFCNPAILQSCNFPQR